MKLDPPPCLKFFQIFFWLFVRGMSADHFGPKIMCLALIEAEKSRVRFLIKIFANFAKNLPAEKLICLPEVQPEKTNIVFIIAVQKHRLHASITHLERCSANDARGT